ncbi:MAG: methyltransferase domain-containing protein [Actinomycetota bacterium]|nr:methyltransferase domain-containing protein [Actinomycetota bacterium]
MADQTTPVAPQEGAGGSPEYGAYYYRHDCGVPYERNQRWLEFFGGIADGIVRDLRPTSFLDAGCAMGFLVEAMRERGVDAYGIDVSEYAISQVHESVADRCKVASLAEPLERRYDLISCIEVLEHIPPEEAGRAVANLCAATDRLLLSTTPSDYSEATHLNVQPPEAWAALLANEGFFRDLERDFSYITPWAALYTRVEESQAETVRRYDRAWSRLRQEANEVRASLLETQRRLAELEGNEGIEDRPELLRRLDELREENLRLRDLLVGKDAELGAAKGALTEHEERSQRLMGAAARIQSRIPGAMRIGGAALRRIQGRRS